MPRSPPWSSGPKTSKPWFGEPKRIWKENHVHLTHTGWPLAPRGRPLKTALTWSLGTNSPSPIRLWTVVARAAVVAEARNPPRMWRLPRLCSISSLISLSTGTGRPPNNNIIWQRKQALICRGRGTSLTIKGCSSWSEVRARRSARRRGTRLRWVLITRRSWRRGRKSSKMKSFLGLKTSRNTARVSILSWKKFSPSNKRIGMSGRRCKGSSNHLKNSLPPMKA